MSDPAIRLNDLDRLAGLLPENTPPHGLAAIARAAVEIRPVGEPINLHLTVEADDAALAEHIAWMRGQGAGGPDEASDPGDDVGIADATADAPPAEVQPDPAEVPVPADPATEATAIEVENPADVRPGSGIPSAPAAIDNLQARVWTDDEGKQLMAARAAGKTFAEIAEQLGRTKKACEVRFRKLGPDWQAAGAKLAIAVAGPAKPAIFPQRSGGTCLAAALAQLDDSFEPVDDRLLVEQRYLGVGFPTIAGELGCDEATAKARWRSILKCGVAHSGGIVTAQGWRDLRAAVAQRAAEAEG